MQRIALLFCFLCTGAFYASAQEQQSFASLSPLLQQGHFAEALTRALGFEDPLLREQCRLHVLWSAGDMQGALSAGRAGLALSPSDLYLLDSTGWLAATLGASKMCTDLSQRFDASMAESQLQGAEREQWQAKGQALAEEAARLGDNQVRRAAAQGRAQLTVGVLALLTLAGIVRFSLRR